MRPRQPILHVTAATLLVAAAIFWRAARPEEHQSPEPEAVPNSITTAALVESSTPTGLSRAARAGLAEARNEPDSSFARQVEIQSLIGADDDLDAVEAWVDEVPEAQLRLALERLSIADRSGPVGELLVRRWAASDPHAAAEWTERLADLETQRALQSAAALAWAETDLSGALAWARTLPDGRNREQVLTSLGYEVARERPVEALQMALGLSSTAERDALIQHGLRQWAAAEAEAARAWLGQWPESEMRHRAAADFATVLADQDGLAGARFAEANLAPGTEFQRALLGVAQRWAQRDLPAAQAWIETFPDPSLRDQARRVLAQMGSD